MQTRPFILLHQSRLDKDISIFLERVLMFFFSRSARSNSSWWCFPTRLLSDWTAHCHIRLGHIHCYTSRSREMVSAGWVQQMYNYDYQSIIISNTKNIHFHYLQHKDGPPLHNVKHRDYLIWSTKDVHSFITASTKTNRIHYFISSRTEIINYCVISW